MKKSFRKMIKIIMLICMIFSSLQTPLVVLADSIDLQSETVPQKGDIKLGEDGEISDSGSVSMIAGVQTIENDGDVQIIKTVTKVNDDGKYKIEFELKGQDVETVQQVTKPIYLVIVFDTSGSMICNSENGSYAYDNWYEAGNNYGTYAAADGTTIYCSNAGRNPNNILTSKWEGAVSGAVSFSDDLTKMANTNVSVVTFSSSASSASAWSQTKLNAGDFGHPVGSTNLKAGINEARAKLATVTVANAQKYILVVGDGSPTAGGTRNTTATQEAKKAATLAKNEGINIFSIGYGIGNGSESDSNDDKVAQEVLKYVSSNMTVNASNPTGNEIGSYEDKGYYHLASTSSLSASLKTVFEEIGEAAKAGTDAEIVDNVGNKFSVVTTNNTDVTYGGSISESVPEITEDGTKVVFYVQIDREAETGWYNTNRGFTLTYTDANNQEQTIIYGDDASEVNPYVYWESYRYQVNYYKDSISEDNKLATEVRVVDKDTVINEENVNKEKYLNEAGEGYEYKLVSPREITVNNPLETPVINVLYTLKEYKYKVEYYYDNVKTDEINNIGPVTHGTEINPKTYYLASEDIRLGYKLDTTNSDKEVVVINNNDKVIKIYYVKDSFDYTVNYHFGKQETIDNKDTNNTGNAVFGSMINPEDKYLSQDKLNSKGYSDYFLNPNKPHMPSEGLVIGADSSKNIIDIYYITTEVENEKTSKKADKSIISSSSELVQYTVNYQANISNVQAGETLTVVIVDTLPKKINLDKSTLNGGVYNEENKTITWTYEIVVDKYTDHYVVDKTVTYTVNYQDFANMSSSLNNVLLNTVKGNITINSNISNGSEDNEEVEVAVEGTVIVKHVDEDGNDLIDSVTNTDKVGTSYSESKKDIYGYTNILEPDNKSGNYIEGTIEVVFVYSKNPGNVTDNKVEKTGLETVDSVDGRFDYTLTYSAVVNDYVGNVTLTLTDELPYELDIEKSTYDNRCTYENKTLVCTQVTSIDEENKEVNEEFKLSLVFKDVNVEKVTNKVVAKLVYGDNSVENNDEVVTEVLKGEVVASYVDEDGNELASEVKTTGLAGTDYETSEKTIYGYTLVEVPENKNGQYVAEETINVEYVYSKNKGTVVENEVVKTQENSIIGVNSKFKYVLTYSGIVKDYVGDATVTLTDKLPYEVADIKYPNSCTYNEETRELVCQKTVELSENNQEIKASFEIEVTYNNLVGTTSLSVLNKVNSSLTFGDTEVTDESEVEDTIKMGTVIATYKDTLGQVLASEEKITGLVGIDYETSEKTIYGYTLVETPENERGTYIDGTITVEYVYSKNSGNVTDNKVEKTGLESVNSVDGKFEYTLTYSAVVNDYVGEVTLTLTDELPYELDIEKSTYDNRCTYENKTLVCTQVISIDEENKEVNEEFKLSLVFKDVNVEKVTNKVVAKLVYGDNSVENNDEVLTEVLKGEVVASYVDEDGNELASEVKTTGLAGTDYETNELEFLGYTLVEVPENKNGQYVANETIEVQYVYSKNIGTSEEELIKTGSEKVFGIDKPFEYTITYNTEVFDYVGEVLIEIKDTPEYEIDVEKSVISDNCQFDNGSIVCNYKLNIVTKEDAIINITENLVLYYKDITSNIVNNGVTATLIYGESIKLTDSEWNTEVAVGDVVVSYVTKDGKKLAEDKITNDLVGKEYQTKEMVFNGYFLNEVQGEVSGKYIDGTINVIYVYSEIPLPPQTGVINNFNIYVNIIIGMIGLFIIKKRIY